ncbi:P-loop containing nucleoside triphosphate hydrolase protein, partial [Lentinula raphanica]
MRQELLLKRKYQNKVLSTSPSSNSNSTVEKTINKTWRPNIVEICDRSYFDKLGIDYGSIKEGTENIIKQFNLNSEQERAFRIIAHHSVGPCTDSLKMYIGGMGGTGKSQVIKALLEFFTLQQRRYAVIVVAPTGNAAALLGGSTYHYLLGINGKFEETPISTMSEVASRLNGIEYIILDEVSMVSCLEMYRISERL